jgi:hypothetical protein
MSGCSGGPLLRLQSLGFINGAICDLQAVANGIEQMNHIQGVDFEEEAEGIRRVIEMLTEKAKKFKTRKGSK